MKASLMLTSGLWVALRKESVDRNFFVVTAFPGSAGSLSARRAWIEIMLYDTSCLMNWVALRKESVDRNPSTTRRLTNIIEVALRKESVDRNLLLRN